MKLASPWKIKSAIFAVAVIVLPAGCGPTAREIAKFKTAEAQDEVAQAPVSRVLPLHWRLGGVDSRFRISDEEVKSAIVRACDLWEAAAGEPLFQYDETDGFPIELTFDDRQELTTEEHQANEELKAAKHDLARSKAKEKEASARYEQAKAKVEDAEHELDARVDSYNRRVDQWNASGGAPSDILEGLRGEQTGLADDRAKLDTSERQLEQMRQETNGFVADYNTLASSYSLSVKSYNARFAAAGSQTVGQCLRVNGQVRSITIYAFRNMDHLTAVLAHELGHALGLQHVTGDGAIMSAIEKGEQYTGDLELTKGDRAALKVALKNFDS